MEENGTFQFNFSNEVKTNILIYLNYLPPRIINSRIEMYDAQINYSYKITIYRNPEMDTYSKVNGLKRYCPAANKLCNTKKFKNRTF